MRYPYKILVRKPEEKRPFGRPSHRWVDNIRMDLREIGWEPGQRNLHFTSVPVSKYRNEVRH